MKKAAYLFVIPRNMSFVALRTSLLTHISFSQNISRMGVSETAAKSRKRKFVPPSHPGPFALVASPGKSKTKVGTFACFDFL